MDEFIIVSLLLITLAAIACGVVLPVIALVQLRQVKRQFLFRIERLEAMLAQRPFAPPPAEYPKTAPRPPIEPPPPARPPAPPPTSPLPHSPTPPLPYSPTPPLPHSQGERLETVIGRRLLGWVAIVLILFAVAFFLRYAFENRWIGEVGRVTLGIMGGIALTASGFRYHRRGWRIFSQILTAGGIMLMYLSVYAAFGFYDLVSQKTAFAFLVILVVEAGGLALLYRAPIMAIMALVGGFLVPILLRSDRDQYTALFSYTAALDAGALALLKQWPGLASIAFGGTHILFWLWYAENYHPAKLVAVMIFQTVVFVFFLAAYIVTQVLRRKPVHLEDLALLVVNPFVFFGTSNYLLDADYHDWMGAFLIALALVYAATGKVMLARRMEAHQLLLTIGTALALVTLAVPIQLRSNWITIFWAVEALALLWAALQVKSIALHAGAIGVFALALIRLVIFDTPYIRRFAFTPLLNRYFLSSIVVVGCLFVAAILYRKRDEEKSLMGLVILLIAVGMLWLVLTVETYTFFETRARAERTFADARHARWLGQMALSVLWSFYAAALAAAGFIRRSASVRWMALALFAVTIIKVVFVDMAALEQFYRIIAFFALGLLLLAVAWGYQKVFQTKEAEK